MINENPDKTEGIHPADIKSFLEKHGTSQTEIAAELSVSVPAVNHVIHGRIASRRIADAIALKIGKSCADLWPGKYDQVA